MEVRYLNDAINSNVDDHRFLRNTSSSQLKCQSQKPRAEPSKHAT
jgi:hypothetical protein